MARPGYAVAGPLLGLEFHARVNSCGGCRGDGRTYARMYVRTYLPREKGVHEVRHAVARASVRTCVRTCASSGALPLLRPLGLVASSCYPYVRTCARTYVRTLRIFLSPLLFSDRGPVGSRARGDRPLRRCHGMGSSCDVGARRIALIGALQRQTNTACLNFAFNATQNGATMNCPRAGRRRRAGDTALAALTPAPLERHAVSFGRKLVYGLPGEGGSRTSGLRRTGGFCLEGPLRIRALGCAPTYLLGTSGTWSVRYCGSR